MNKAVCRRRGRCALLGLLLVGGIAFWRCLPDPLFQEPQSTILSDREGRLLGAKIASDQQWRFPESDRVPDKFRTAILAFEDKRFAYHPGVDPLALGRALYLNFKAGSIASGGSTLSMQVIRLARGNPPRTYAEKLVEMVQALRLELTYSKDAILALYAGHAPFGGNVVGLEAAAWRYFARDPAQLSWAESCLLAVLPNNPALVHPGRNRDKLKHKRDALLKRLQEEGVLTDVELTLALREPLPEKPQSMPRAAPHLLDTLIKEQGEGQRFLSTLDAEIQQRAEGIVMRHSAGLQRHGIKNAAALIIDNDSFEVVAYVGNSGMDDTPDSGYSLDLIRRPRSTGSLLKPLLFAAMIDSGEILPKTLVPDVPTQYSGYMPENYDRQYRGAVPAQQALAQSLNVPAVKMLRQHGVARFFDFLRHMGMNTLFRTPEEYGLTLILGGAEGTLWELTTMYANVAWIAKAKPVDTPRYRNARPLVSEPERQGMPAELSPGAAWLTLNALVEVTRPEAEFHWKNFSSSRKIAWKTGTSYGLRDAWAIGSSTRYTIGVWAGNASGEGRPELTGTTAAAPMLFDLFNALEASPWFAPPAADMKQVSVCKDDGYLTNGDCETEPQWVPRDSHFEKVTPHHHRVHLDGAGRWRVHGACESVANMQHRGFFILPPTQAHYYKKHHPEYRPLPPYRSDCSPLSRNGAPGPIGLLYPSEGTRLYIPVDLGGKKSRAVFEAVHDNAESLLYWHMDDEYLGMTKTFHQMALDMSPGRHRLTLVDEAGNRLVRNFEALGKE